MIKKFLADFWWKNFCGYPGKGTVWKSGNNFFMVDRTSKEGEDIFFTQLEYMGKVYGSHEYNSRKNNSAKTKEEFYRRCTRSSSEEAVNYLLENHVAQQETEIRKLKQIAKDLELQLKEAKKVSFLDGAADSFNILNDINAIPDEEL